MLSKMKLGKRFEERNPLVLIGICRRTSLGNGGGGERHGQRLAIRVGIKMDLIDGRNIRPGESELIEDRIGSNLSFCTIVQEVHGWSVIAADEFDIRVVG